VAQTSQAAEMNTPILSFRAKRGISPVSRLAEEGFLASLGMTKEG
jgi:hypothetical protein